MGVRALVDEAIKDPVMKNWNRAVKAVVAARDIKEAFRLAIHVPKKPHKDLEALVVQHGTAQQAYQWARTFEDADLQALARIVAPSFVYSVEFERHFGNIDDPRRP